ncbi:MAG: hypothetical protein KAU95_02750, partial [Candidatus Aenigmarchaeota archaeon]|nr:hypothetical protein [Candidatus Aenigmarchaeota archaeon]
MRIIKLKTFSFMAKFGHGKIRKARSKLKRTRGNEGITKYLKSFKEGEKAVIKIDSSSQNYPHPRHQGAVGEIKGKRGRAYIVNIKSGKKEKQIITTPEHLKKL